MVTNNKLIYFNGNGDYQFFCNTLRSLCESLSSEYYKQFRGKDYCGIWTPSEPELLAFAGMYLIYNKIHAIRGHKKVCRSLRAKPQYNSSDQEELRYLIQILDERVRPYMGKRFCSIGRCLEDISYLETCMNKLLVKIFMSDLDILRVVNISQNKFGKYASIGVSYPNSNDVTYICKSPMLKTFKSIQSFIKTQNAVFVDATRFSHKRSTRKSSK